MKEMREIGLFIINNKGEMLLHKKTDLWQTPCLAEHALVHGSTEAVKAYLENLGMVCQLHEAFMGNDVLGRQIIIAISMPNSPDLHFATESYKWLSIDNILRDMHDHSARYAPWFITALEGVALYVKNLLKNHANAHTQNISEI